MVTIPKCVFLALGMPSSLGWCKISTEWLVTATFCHWLYTIAADLMEFDSMFLDVVDSLFVYVMFFFLWVVFFRVYLSCSCQPRMLISPNKMGMLGWMGMECHILWCYFIEFRLWLWLDWRFKDSWVCYSTNLVWWFRDSTW